MAESLQTRLIRDLEPVVAEELERHLKIAKDWYPHEYVPWSMGQDFTGILENGVDWDPKDSKLSKVAQDALVLNLLTEDNLPSYHTEIAITMGRDGAWGTWVDRWTAEEGRHGIVLRDYLMVTRGADPRELEDLRMAHMQAGYQSDHEQDMLHTVAYVSFQELATRISHRNTGMISGDPVCEQMLSRVALDENLHMLFYRNLLGKALEMAPNEAMRAITDVLTGFQMPGHGMPGFGRKSVQIALAGIYDMRLHHDDVIAPVLRAWGVWDLDTLSGDGQAARDELAIFLAGVDDQAKAFEEKRAAHFERSRARGVEVITLVDA
jgi:acyl-[acyl-carrier-protein] desaturase